MTALEAPLADHRVFAEFDIEPADLAYLRSVHETLTAEIQEWVLAQWRAEVEGLPWFEALGLPEGALASLAETTGRFLRRLLEGDRVEELYDEIGQAALVALRCGVSSTDLFQASTKLESILTGVILQLFPSSDQQTVALVTVAKFLKSLLYVVMETYRREAANELEGRNRELAAALEQQTATAEVLQVINSSPGDLVPVFDSMLEKALHLCEAASGQMWSFDGEHADLRASRDVPTEFLDYLRREPPGAGPDTFFGRAILTRSFVTSSDVASEEPYLKRTPLPVAAVELGGIRAVLMAPLVKDNAVTGVFSIYRREVRPFTDKQIALLQNFAAQAVIAMENARLLTETREALEQQTATAEVLQIINSSPGELAPVFDAILDKAMTLCNASLGAFYTYDGEKFHGVTYRGISPQLAEALHEPARPHPSGAVARILDGEAVAQIADLSDSEGYRAGNPVARDLVDAGGARTVLVVALRKDKVLLGYLGFHRQEVRLFSDKEIALLQNFAAQAVIAMGNARLITETREALAQQTATAEVLQVINSSPGNLAPVFDAMLEKAMHLCGASFGILRTYDGALFHTAAAHGVPDAYGEFLIHNPQLPAAGTSGARILDGDPAVHIIDLAEAAPYRAGEAHARAIVELGGARTSLAVALTKEGAILGALQIYRQEVSPFTDKQIALLQNFAAQAVIAMENARLITETREALEQQTATAEILRVISNSPADLQPTFDAIAAAARTLTDAALGSVVTYDGKLMHVAALAGFTSDEIEKLRRLFPIPADHGTATGRAITSRQAAHIQDMAVDPEHAYPALAQSSGETVLAVPMLRDGMPIGAINVQRRRAEPFTDKQIGLIKTFADQAVIAMDNARLITETRQALEQQTATAEVLGVINASPGDLQPVFNAMLEKAMRLCEVVYGVIRTYDGQAFHEAARCGEPHVIERTRQLGPLRSGPNSLVEPLVQGERVIQIADLAAEADRFEPAVRENIEITGARTWLAVALHKEGLLLGAIFVYRREVRPFSDKQIALLQNFAAQAVIAMENARLITETREALEQQTATAEVLGVINSSPGDLAPVFDIVLEKAMRLCNASFGSFATFDGERFPVIAHRGVPAEFVEAFREPLLPPPGTALARIGLGEAVVQVADLREAGSYRSRSRGTVALVEIGGARSAIWVALRREEKLLGVLCIFRQEVRPFTDKEVALLESFAAQAVIAIDNTRLLDEIRQRQAQLRVTFDNMGDGVAMFDAEMRLAAWNLNFQQLLDLPEALLTKRPSFAEYLRYLAERGEYGPGDVEEELSRRLDRTDQELRFERTRPDGRVIEVRRNAVPGGGFVLIYGDVTERKRAEAEIRAARDAAEKALRELQAAQTSLVHAQKMAALGQLTAGIAHEIKNPLNFVNNFAGLSVELLDELKQTTAPAIASLDEDTRAEIDETVQMLTSNLEKIAEHGQRADGIVKSMLQHSRGGSGDWQATDLNALVEEALNLAYHGARAQDQNFNITMDRDLDRNLAPIEVVPQDIMRVFLNLIGNGFYAASKKGREAGDGFRPILKVVTRNLGEAIEIRVRDNGTGIAPEHRDRLFQPFFTTKPTGEGTGLGLSISYDIVTQQHGGTIAVDSEEGQFTEFTIRLPRRGYVGNAMVREGAA